MDLWLNRKWNGNHLMKIFLIFSILIVTITSVAVNQSSELKITMFYESLCPFSKKFLIEQLIPTYEKLKFYVDFVPYGHAYHLMNPFKIACQHGPDECAGNMLHACAIDELPKTKDVMRFIQCTWIHNEPHKSGQRCSQALHLNFTPIQECTNSDRGQQLLAKFGNQTHAIDPPIIMIPAVTFNDIYDLKIDRVAIRNLEQAICIFYGTVAGCEKVEVDLDFLSNDDVQSHSNTKSIYIKCICISIILKLL